MAKKKTLTKRVSTTGKKVGKTVAATASTAGHKVAAGAAVAGGMMKDAWGSMRNRMAKKGKDEEE